MPSGGFPTQPDNGPASVRHRCAGNGCRSPIGGRDGYEASPNCDFKRPPYRIL